MTIPFKKHGTQGTAHRFAHYESKPVEDTGLPDEVAVVTYPDLQASMRGCDVSRQEIMKVVEALQKEVEELRQKVEALEAAQG